MKYIVGASIITESEVIENSILGFDGAFQFIIPKDRFDSKSMDIIDASGLYIAPGLIDMHIHGCGGKDSMDGTKEALETISTIIAKNGVTSFLATTMTMDKGSILQALRIIKDSMGKMPAAQLLGAHMEGPFINCKFKGAQNQKYIKEPDYSYIDEALDIIKIITLAPEVQGAKELVYKLREKKIIASIGHSAATYEEAMEGIEAGFSHCTHLFNAMTGIHHRTPGVAAAALASDIYCEVIADKIHIHPGNFEFIRKAKGTDRIILITDCIEAGGMGDGTYSLGGQPVYVKDGAARLQDGTLAGSVLNLNNGLFNFYKNTKAKLHEVFNMASLNPAKELKIADKKGSIAIGKDADFFLMDKDFNVISTFVKGICVYTNE